MIRQPVVAHELPDFFYGVQFGCLLWWWQEKDVGENIEFCVLIKDEGTFGRGDECKIINLDQIIGQKKRVPQRTR